MPKGRNSLYHGTYKYGPQRLNKGCDMADPTGSTEEVVPPQRHPAPPEADVRIPTPTGTWNRIKEHKILQWGLGYLGAAIAIAHGQELMAEAFDWPHLVGRILMSVLVLGLPLVLTLAWYHGHKGLKRVGPGEMAIISLLILIAAGLLVVFVRAPGERAPTLAAQETVPHSPAVPIAPPAGVSLAVLPFVDMSPEHNQEYFSDGLSEELLNQLAQIRELRVTGRTSSFSFKGKNEDLRVIGEKLGVGNILEGSVRKDGNHLRITAQLINSKDGTHLWSQTFDRELSGVFAIQEEIAKSVSQALSIALDVGEMSRAKGGTTNLEAYDKFLRARELSRQRGGKNDILEAAGSYRAAVALDPNFVRAWSGLYDALADTMIYVPENAAAAQKEMDEVSAHMVALAPDAWWTQAMLAIQFIDQHKWSKAEAAARAALASIPASQIGTAEFYTRFLWGVGRAQEVVPYYERARQADPLSLSVSYELQIALFIAGRPEAAQAEYERSKSLAGDHGMVDRLALERIWSRKEADPAPIRAQYSLFLQHEGLATTLDHILADRLGNREAALAAIHMAFDDPTNQTVNGMRAMAFDADHFGDQDLALAALRRAYVDLGGTNIGVMWELKTDLRADPRFKDILRDVGLVDYFRASGNWGDFCKPVSKDDFECH